MNQNTLEGGGQLSGHNKRSVRTSSVFSRFLAGLIASVMALAGLVAVGPAAYATQNLVPTVLHNGSVLQEGAIVSPDDKLTLQIQYDNTLDASQPAVFSVNGPVTFDESTLEVAAGIVAIDRIEEIGEEIHVYFKNPEDWGSTTQGVVAIDFTFDEVERTLPGESISWEYPGGSGSLEVVVRKPGDNQANVNNWLNKSASGGIYENYVSIDPETDTVQLAENITDYAFNYTLNINTHGDTNRDSFTIADTISEYLVYNEDSFSASMTQWDEHGWNQTSGDLEFEPDFEGNGFSSTVDLPSPSQVTIKYTASLNPEMLDELQAALQASYESMEGEYGGFGFDLDNTVTFGGDETRTGTVEVGLLIREPAPDPGPGLNNAFSKTADIWTANVELDDESNILDPVAVTYTLTANLAQWTGEAPEGQQNHEDFTLDRNVVVHDALSPQIQWDTEADDFLTFTGAEFTEADNFSGDAEAFAADEYVGQYAFVDNNLYVNIGQDSSTNVEIKVKALITTVEGLRVQETNAQGWERYATSNRGYMYFGGEQDALNTRWVSLWDRGDISGGVNDPNRFSKDASGEGTKYIQEGESVTIDYDFVVQGVDVTKSYIVDERDPNVFDFSDEATLTAIQENISGQYAGWRPMGPGLFDVSVNDDGDLVIQLSEAGVEFVGDNVTNRLEITVPLTTVEFGRQTVTIENHAVLYGEDEGEPLYWSETTSEASSYFGEAELRKAIRDTPNQEWTQNLRAEIGEDGELIQDEYVYNLAFIPHRYSNVKILPEIDELPEEVEFLGFVTDENVDTGANPVDGPVDIGGDLEAVYDEDSHTVTIQQKEGTLLRDEPNISANVLVRVLKFEEDVPVINVFGNSSATYTPSDGYPISIAKMDSEDDEVVINDPESRFNVLDEDDNIVIENAFVENGQLRVLNDEGEITGLVVREPGTYYVEEVLAPQGYELSTDRIRVVVDADGSSQQVTFLNDPADDPTYGVGDYVWIDENGDGQQDSEEPPLEGVTVELYKWDEGSRSEEPVATTTTDENGRYLFDELEAGEYQVRFILTTEQEEKYYFTESEYGDTESDSDAVENGYSGRFILDDDAVDPDYSDQDFKATQGVDPTWDAGVVERTYAIGDYVWIDDNRDGVQDEDEKPLEGVKVVLYDGEGEEIDDTTTDENGRYIFDNLKAGEYSVQFILTDDQAEMYEFTLETEGDDLRHDSDADEEGRSGTIALGPDNTFLTADEDYDHNTVEASEGIDPTWDAGVVLIPVPEIQVDKNEPGDDVHQVSAGEQDVVVTITNEGNEDLENFHFEDTTEEGHDVVWNEADLAGLEELVLAPGDSYTVNGTVQVDGDTTHRDNVVVHADGVISGETVNDDDPTTYNADPSYAIGDYVWVDSNRDGVQDEGEKPLEGVKVVLYDGAGEEIDDTTTDENGRYIFDNLDAGEYQVRFILTDEQADLYKFTTYTEGDDSTVDSNAGEEGRSATIMLNSDNEFLTADEDYDYNDVEASRGIDPTWDAGVQFIVQPEIQVDKNESGDDVHQVSAGEQDVVVTFTNQGDEALENFEFEDTTEEGHDVVWNEADLAGLEDLVLEPGDSYTINGVVQVDAETTHRDNVVVSAHGVISGEAVEDDDPTTYNADPTYAIGDYVWIDKDRDGVQDEDEPALDGVIVELYTVDEEGNPSEEPVDSTETDEHGRYIFDNLDAGDYQVRFILTEEQADLYKFTTYTEGDDTTEDSNAGNEGRSGTITLGPDNEFLTADEDYDYNTVEASRGIDPTWDAGVQFIVQPEIQVEKNESGDDVHQVTAGDHDVTVTITNEGDEDLENFQFEDTTEEGHDVVWNEQDLAGLEDLVLEPGDSYTVNGVVQVDAGTTHRDEVVINANGVISGEAVEDDDPTTYEADEVPPTPAEDPSDPADPAGTDEDTPGDQGGKLSKTGASFALIFGALGLLLLAIGIVLYVRNRQSSKV